MSYQLTQQDFVQVLELAAQDGLAKPAELIAAIAAAIGVHPDHLPLVKSATDRVRASYKRIISSPLKASLEALRRPLAGEQASTPPATPEVPPKLLEGYLAAGVAQETVEALWLKHPYWLKLSLKVFSFLVAVGRITNPDGFLVQCCRKKWFLHPNYDPTYRQQQLEKQAVRKQADETLLREREDAGRKMLDAPQTENQRRIKALLGKIGMA